MNMKVAILFLFSIAAFFVFLPATASAQRDYFTAEEVELIRDAQKIDDRMALLKGLLAKYSGRA